MPKDAETAAAAPIPSPRTVLRARRPEQFSDSSAETTHELTSDYLGFLLENLTAQHKESAFENFARFLCQREVCPNILPQTGPVGGGDSKTDGSTYPVAQTLSEGWPWYLARAAASEFWAFAFSAKEDWRGKVKQDAGKIAALSTRPSKMFFVTNQPVRDKARAEVIEQVRAENGLDLTILDRTWIVERTLQKGHQDLVTDALGVSLPKREQRVLGPIDSQRQTALDALEAALATEGATSRPTALLVEDYLLGARLCRGLDLPKHRVLGFLNLAQETAAANGSQALLIDALYQSAWTLFWWYEDAFAADRLYDSLEPLVLQANEPWYCELLGNIWMALLSHARRDGDAGPTAEKHAARRQRLSAKLGEIERDTSRPNAGTYAKLLRLTAELQPAVIAGDGLPNILSQFGQALREADRMPFAPVLPTLDVLEEIGRFLPNSPEYDDLFELSCEIRSRRGGGRVQGATLLNRGLQLLDAKEPDKALTYLTRARQLLAKYEALGGLSRAVGATAVAYQLLGLRWAARLEFVRALSIETRDLRLDAKATRFAARLAERLTSLDLSLGRLPSALAWKELAVLFAASTGDYEWSVDEDGLFAIAILHSALADLPYLGVLDVALNEQDFMLSSAALLFLLGHEAAATERLPEAFKDDGIEATCRRLSEQPAADQMSLPPTYGLCGPIEWSLDLRPSRVQMVVDPDPAAMATAEHLGALVEILVYAMGALGARPVRSAYRIRIRASSIADNPPRLLRSDSGRREFDLDVAIKPDVYRRSTVAAQAEEAEWLAEAAVLVTAAVTMLDEVQLEQAAKDGVLGQVFGYSACARFVQELYPLTRYRLQPTDQGGGGGALPYIRTVPWQPAPRSAKADASTFVPEISSVIDVVRADLWSEARWIAMGFLIATAGDVSPMLAFVFRSAEAGIRAFKHMQSAIAGNPQLIRIAVVTDAPRGRYVVQISGEPSTKSGRTDVGETFLMVTKLQGFHSSPGLPRLEAFRREHDRIGGCVICPSIQDGASIRPLEEGSIEGVKVVFRARGSVGNVNDRDALALQKLDEEDD